MNKLKESILNDAKKDASNASNETTASPTLPPPLPTALPTPPQVILLSMTLVYSLSLPLAFAYFLQITLPRLQIKNESMKNRINRQNNGICFRKIYNKTSSFDWKKNIEDSINDEIIMTATTTGIFFEINVKLPKASLDAMNIMKFSAGICGGGGEVLMKDYAVYKKGSTSQRVIQKNSSHVTLECSL